MHRRNRQRRHSHEEEEEETHGIPPSVASQKMDGEESELTRKETEIWDAFREEHYEGILHFKIAPPNKVLTFST